MYTAARTKEASVLSVMVLNCGVDVWSNRTSLMRRRLPEEYEAVRVASKVPVSAP